MGATAVKASEVSAFRVSAMFAMIAPGAPNMNVTLNRQTAGRIAALPSFSHLAACGGGPAPQPPPATPAAPPAKDMSDIKVGVYGSLTGAQATFAVHEGRREPRIRRDQRSRRHHGPQGRRDPRGRSRPPDQASLVVEKLINSDKVVAVIGEWRPPTRSRADRSASRPASR